VVNHSRFLILPDGHWFNWGSRVLSLCQRRLPKDWEEAFGHGVVLLETFVDPQRPSLRGGAAQHQQKERQTFSASLLRPDRPPGRTSQPATSAPGQRGHWRSRVATIGSIGTTRTAVASGPTRPGKYITRLRRFALGVLKSKGRGNVAEKMRRLTRSVRLVFDYCG
jgi:hypothetical protein